MQKKSQLNKILKNNKIITWLANQLIPTVKFSDKPVPLDRRPENKIIKNQYPNKNPQL
jgi:hypothetical protein